jgi:hypothetical protein
MPDARRRTISAFSRGVYISVVCQATQHTIEFWLVSVAHAQSARWKRTTCCTWPEVRSANCSSLVFSFPVLRPLPYTPCRGVRYPTTKHCCSPVAHAQPLPQRHCDVCCLPAYGAVFNVQSWVVWFCWLATFCHGGPHYKIVSPSCQHGNIAVTLYYGCVKSVAP